MMKDSIDKVLKEKYLDVQIPKFDLDNLKLKKSYKGYKIAIFILLIISVIGIKLTITIIKNNSNTNIHNSINQNLVAGNDIKLPVATETIKIGTDISSIAFLDVDYVAIIKVNKILGYTNYSNIQNKYVWPITKLEVTVEKSLKGELEKNIQINRDGGIISIANFEKLLNKEKIEKYGYNKLSEKEKENTYVNVIMGQNYGKCDPNKTYLVFLREDKETYGGLTITAGYMEEYDEKTQSTRYGNGWLPIKDNVVIQKALQSK